MMKKLIKKNGYYEPEQKKDDDGDDFELGLKTKGLPQCSVCARQLLYAAELADGLCAYCKEDEIEPTKKNERRGESK